MSDYIINPWLFYWIGVCNSLDIVSQFFSAIALVCSLAFTVIKYSDGEEYFSLKKLYIATCMIIAVCIALPSEKTCYRMLIASVVTKSNVQATQEYIIESIDKAVEKIIYSRRGR